MGSSVNHEPLKIQDKAFYISVLIIWVVFCDQLWLSQEQAELKSPASTQQEVRLKSGHKKTCSGKKKKKKTQALRGNDRESEILVLNK